MADLGELAIMVRAEIVGGEVVGYHGRASYVLSDADAPEYLKSAAINLTRDEISSAAGTPLAEWLEAIVAEVTGP